MRSDVHFLCVFKFNYLKNVATLNIKVAVELTTLNTVMLKCITLHKNANFKEAPKIGRKFVGGTLRLG